MRLRLLVLVPVCVGGFAAAPTQAADGLRLCPRFVVGTANSTAYTDFRLPARGVADGDTCAALRRLARGVQDGRYPVPAGEEYRGRPPEYGAPFRLRARLIWSCRLQARGASGPSYAVRCTRPRAAVRWSVG